MKQYALYMTAAAALMLCQGCLESHRYADGDRSGGSQGMQNTSSSASQRRMTTNSGLSYEIIRPGSGASPRKGKRVTVHYTGWLNANGAKGPKFDSSVDRKTPFTFTIGVGQVIKGWDEGVLSMQVGEQRRLYIPATLGYGPYGAGTAIPANADLIFEVELISVE